MPRSCTVCASSRRQQIDEALVAGQSARRVAALYRVSDDAVSRHNAAHLPRNLVKAQEAEEVADADKLLEQVQDLKQRGVAILTKAEDMGDLRTALMAIRETRGTLELLARLAGQIAEQAAQVNIEGNRTFTLNLGDAEPKLSDSDIDQRITVMLQIRDRALRRAEQGDLSTEELVPLLDASVAEYRLSQSDPHASLDRKLASMAARREREPEPEPIGEQGNNVTLPAEPVVGLPEPPRRQPGPAPARSPHWVARGW